MAATLHQPVIRNDRWKLPRVERAGLPGLHLFDHGVGDPGHQVPGHLGAVDVGEVVGDVSSGHALRIQTQHRVVEPSQPPGVLGEHRRCERAGPVPWHLDPDLTDVGADRLRGGAVADVAGAGPVVAVVTEVLGQLHVQRCLQHLLGQPGQQPTRPGQLHPLRPGRRHQLIRQRRKIRRHGRRLGSLLCVSELCGHA
jgi:hypothetical protein